MQKHIKRHFIGWEKPLPQLVGEIFIDNHTDGIVDLSDTLIIVPTRNAGRRLREALAESAARHRSAAAPGPVVTPEYLASPRSDLTNRPASNLERVSILCRLLLDLKPEQYPELFPRTTNNTQTKPSQATSSARRLAKLSDELAENGLDFRTAARVLTKSNLNPEPERWENLARLEENYLARLSHLELTDPNQAKIQFTANPKVPEHITRIALIGVADPLPLALRSLDILSSKIPVDIYIHAPGSEEETFDQWGRPLPDKWNKKIIDIPDPEANLILAGRPDEQAETVAEMLQERQIKANDLAIGMPDKEVTAYIERELNESGWPTFNPAGSPMKEHSLAELTISLIRFLQSRDYQCFAALVRHPDFILYFKNNDPHFVPASFLTQLDKAQNRHIPATFSDLHAAAAAQEESDCPALLTVCNKIETWLDLCQKGGMFETILKILGELFSVKQLDNSREEDRIFRQVALEIKQTIEEINTDFIVNLKLPEEVSSTLLIDRLSQSRVYPEREREAIDLQGWLELGWEDSPCLIITGMNEGRVPASVTADSFLPDSAREILELSSNRSRFARDAFLLQTVIACRRKKGRNVFIAGKTSAQGDPLKPSRLLMLCPEPKLPERVKTLFAEYRRRPDKGLGSRTTSCLLNPPPPSTPTSLRVTQFSDYLKCPFRFYLKHLLGMEEMDDTKTELDALDFGTICHEALEILNRPDLRKCVNPELIEDKLLKKLKHLIKQRFGKNLSASLYFQSETMGQRLAAAARQEAALHEEGWRIIHTELKLGRDTNSILADMPLRGRVDRIDQHENGIIRILDYKTSETAATPESIMWSTPRENTPDYAMVTVNGKEKAWSDLQLPLYLLLLRDQFPGQTIECGYFNLPKATTDTSVSVLSFSPELIESAELCALGVINDIKNGRFWPPASKTLYDDFEKILFGTPEKHVAPESIRSLQASP